MKYELTNGMLTMKAQSSIDEEKLRELLEESEAQGVAASVETGSKKKPVILSFLVAPKD